MAGDVAFVKVCHAGSIYTGSRNVSKGLWEVKGGRGEGMGWDRTAPGNIKKPFSSVTQSASGDCACCCGPTLIISKCHEGK